MLAAGSGSRTGSVTNKALLALAGTPMLVWSVRTALAIDGVHRLVLVVRSDEQEAVAQAVAPHLGSSDVWLVEGGATRHESEQRALAALRRDIDDEEVEVVAVHDAARPLATPELWRAVIDTAAARGGALPVLPEVGLLPREPVERAGEGAAESLVAVQTPQAFRAAPLLAAYDRAQAEGFTGSDTAACLEAYADLPLVAVPGEAANLKVTWADDLRVADRLLTG
ncbi:2-C-methyl-D-erythritol 4-phosphate cytidylyltransferase [Nocardioides mangrovicus]|uniref:2-C-methyl-D-erythritol 4-phosphate cytidylyltransferase n=1 Tax=Nocardioides mangrovicus TaxID=2478913 RepID=A0A3L8P0N0_9ACTN|nr:2-C-methyl-D-erythritol 4-phosphate cytidylyltransferase [Nocardioides mangrovicus]